MWAAKGGMEELDGPTADSLQDSASNSAATVVKLAFSPLTNAEAKALLENPPEDKISTFPPVLPKAGEVYIYSFSESSFKGIISYDVYLLHPFGVFGYLLSADL